jgi:hypothetical protein
MKHLLKTKNLLSCLVCLHLLYPLHAKWKPRLWEHHIEMMTMVTFKPNNSFQRRKSPSNAYLEYVYGTFNSYKNPGLGYGYHVDALVTKKIRAGIRVAALVRYLQKTDDENYDTFYSIPVTATGEYPLAKTKNHRYTLEANAGYNFKHPKKRWFDGLGGWTGGFLLKRHYENKGVQLYLGYQFFQEKKQLRYVPSPNIPEGVEEIFRFKQFTNQISFGFGKRIEW